MCFRYFDVVNESDFSEHPLNVLYYTHIDEKFKRPKLVRHHWKKRWYDFLFLISVEQFAQWNKMRH